MVDPTCSWDGWVLRGDLGELTKDGHTVRLPDQPLLILQELLARPGELVTREHLIAKLWPNGVVDFETGLNSAVRKLRVALHDQADSPRYIETVPRRGYRFIGQLDGPAAVPVVLPVPTPASAADSAAHIPSVESANRHSGPRYLIGALMLTLIAVGAGFFFSRTIEPDAETPSRSPATASPLDTLAVLPLHGQPEDEAALRFAQTMTELLRERLARLGGVTVISSTSAQRLGPKGRISGARADTTRARYVVDGSAQRVGERFRINVRLTDTRSGNSVWSNEFDRALTELGAVREDIVRHIARELRIEPAPPGTDTIIDLDAYQLYVRGQQLMSNHAVADVEAAMELFQRATILHPRFARAFVGLGQAKLLRERLAGRPESEQIWADAQRSFKRAIDIDASLGEAWIERARLSREPREAEALYLRGLQLAPNYGVGHLRYAEFLFGNSRMGEAIEEMNRARAIDPLTPNLHVRQAFFVMVARSDVAQHRRLLREALEINPEFRSALHALAHSYWEYTGEFAAAAELIEHLIDVDPQFPTARSLARNIYLDLFDPAAAKAVLAAPSATPQAMMEVAQYERDRAGAALIATGLHVDSWADTGSLAPTAEALRDDAIERGSYTEALALLRAFGSAASMEPRMWHRAFALVHAHTLMLSGDVEGGRRLVASTLALLDAHSVGRTPHWFSRERATALALLGDDQQALDELEHAVRDRRLYRWWYLAEMDPVFERVRRHPRFLALDKQARRYIEEQRAQLEKRRSARVASGESTVTPKKKQLTE